MSSQRNPVYSQMVFSGNFLWISSMRFPVSFRFCQWSGSPRRSRLGKVPQKAPLSLPHRTEVRPSHPMSPDSGSPDKHGCSLPAIRLCAGHHRLTCPLLLCCGIAFSLSFICILQCSYSCFYWHKNKNLSEVRPIRL